MPERRVLKWQTEVEVVVWWWKRRLWRKRRRRCGGGVMSSEWWSCVTAIYKTYLLWTQ